VDGTVDHEGGFFFEVFAQAGVEPIQFLDYATEVPQTSTVNSRTPPVYRRLKPRRHSLVGTDPARSASRAARTMGGGIDNSVTRP
jgi:hypothetical protein